MNKKITFHKIKLNLLDNFEENKDLENFKNHDRKYENNEDFSQYKLKKIEEKDEFQDQIDQKSEEWKEDKPPNRKETKHFTNIEENKNIYKVIKEKILLLLDSKITTILMTVLTIYALFGDDIRQLSTNQNGDTVFYSFHLIGFSLFMIEIILSSIARYLIIQ